jgi:DNA-binding MarR family transcriptional regulator
MNRSSSGPAAAHLTNLLGALAVGCADLQLAGMHHATALDEAALAALLAVHTRPGSTIRDVASTTGLTHSGAVRTADRLQHAGLVIRTAKATDRRIVGLHCTRAGTAKANAALASRRAGLAALVAGAAITASELPMLEHLLERLLEGLPKADRGDAWHICRLCEHTTCRGGDCPVGRTVP